MTDKKKAARAGTLAASNTTLKEHSTSPQRQNKDPLKGWYSLAKTVTKPQAESGLEASGVQISDYCAETDRARSALLSFHPAPTAIHRSVMRWARRLPGSRSMTSTTGAPEPVTTRTRPNVVSV